MGNIFPPQIAGDMRAIATLYNQMHAYLKWRGSLSRNNASAASGHWTKTQLDLPNADLERWLDSPKQEARWIEHAQRSTILPILVQAAVQGKQLWGNAPWPLDSVVQIVAHQSQSAQSRPTLFAGGWRSHKQTTASVISCYLVRTLQKQARVIISPGLS